MSLFPRALAPIFIAMLCVIVPTGAWAQSPTGGTAFEVEPPPPAMLEPGAWTGPEVPGDVAVLQEDGTAAAPANAPEQVKQAIWAANSMQELPYRYGGGHNLKFDVADGTDCSGTVSFALKAGGLLDAPLDSGSFMTWGEKGKGDWITIYANSGHMYAVIAGLRLDTSMTDGKGPGWSDEMRSSRGYKKRHFKDGY
jgi:hypothetical protein